MQLSIICNYVLSLLQVLTILLNLYYFCDYDVITKLHILPYLLNFSSKNRPLCSFGHKITYNLVTFYGVLIHLLYIKILWTTLQIYLTYSQCILGIS